jgi:hypothetical protein
MRAFRQPGIPAARREHGARLRLPHTMSCCGASRERAGVALVLFALLVFGLMGIMAVAIDVGVASLTQAQMQNAVDTAAIEGMRLRNFMEDPHLSDRDRRPHVSELIQMVFDDNLHPTGGVKPTPWPWYHGGLAGMPPDGPDQLNLGAGPVWDMQPGEGAFNVGETYNPFPKVYDDPVLETNFEPVNEVDGDMVAGTYMWNVPHVEQSDYTRADFDTATHDYNESKRALGFLVRMRRCNEPAIPGESSGAPALPFLFGLGSTIRQADGSAWNPRTDGITVRAEAIASVRPAMTVGPPPDRPDLIGNPMLGVGFWYTSTATPAVRVLGPAMALSVGFWLNTLPQGHIGYNLTESSGALSYNGTVVGTFLASGSAGGVGVPIQAGPAPQDVPPETFPVIVVIQAPISNGGSTTTDRVIGYAYGTIKYDGTHWIITKGFQNEDPPDCYLYVAPGNATARMSPNTPSLSSTERNSLFTAYFNFAYSTGTVSYDWHDLNAGIVLAPVLVR